MAQEKKTFTHLSLQDSQSIQSVLNSIADALGKGEMVFKDEEDEIELKPQGLIRLKVSATKSENRNRLNIKLSWEEHEEQLATRKIVTVKNKKKHQGKK